MNGNMQRFIGLYKRRMGEKQKNAVFRAVASRKKTLIQLHNAFVRQKRHLLLSASIFANRVSLVVITQVSVGTDWVRSPLLRSIGINSRLIGIHF